LAVAFELEDDARIECYHCAVAHPSFSAAIDVRQENYNLTAHGWFSSQIGQVRPSALEGRSQVKIYDVGGEVAQSQYHLLWPNMTININPGFPNLSIDENALVSRFLHTSGKPGLRIEAVTPRGKFTLMPESERPVVFVSGGVGVTPMIAMAGHIVEEGRRTGKFRPVWFIHGTHNGRAHAFGKHVRELAREHPAIAVHIRYSQPGDEDRLGITDDGEGHVTTDVMKALLPLNDYDFYLCGPPPFMQSLFDGLTGIGAASASITSRSAPRRR
jgi:Na+-transporting NADH:ubiquinone oxidoreductase subunit NqrF